MSLLPPSNYKILVVDDEILVAFECQHALKRLGYNALEIAHTAKDALIKCKTQRPDLILMDVCLCSGLDGINLGEIIRKEFDVPLVFMSGFWDRDSIEKAKIAEPCGYLVKPFMETDLSFIVDIALQQSESRRILLQHKKQYSFISDLGLFALESGNSLQEIFRYAATGAAECMDADYSAFLTFTEDEKLDLVATYGWEADAGTTQVSVKKNSIECVALNSIEPIIIENLREEIRFAGADQLLHHGITSGIVLVIRNPGKNKTPRKPLGIFGICSREYRKFSQEDVRFLQALSNVLAWSILRSSSDQSLKKASDRIQDMYDNAPCGYHSLNQDGLVIQMNTTELKWLGYTPEEVIGKKKITDLITAESRAEFYKKFPEFIKYGFVRDIEFHMLRKDGTTFPALLSSTAIRDAEGRFLLSRSTAIDLTERKKVETAKRVQEDSEYFARIISHDLREPVRNIGLFAELILRDHKQAFDDSSKTYLGYIRDGAKRLASMVESLSIFAIQTSYLTPPEEVDLNELVKGVVDSLKVQMDSSGAKVQMQSLPSVYGQRGQLLHIFHNLISNSIKYHGNQPLKIEVKATSSSNDWEISISDNGRGFDPQHSEAIFMPFRRLKEREDENIEGHGMGLAICKRLVSGHGGRIWATSQPHEGSTFTFSLPKKESLIEKAAM